MNPVSLVLTFTLMSFTLSSAIPKTENGKRVVEHEPLSKQEHFGDEDHNADYDHEAFLGEEEARTFDDLTPEESKRRLGLIFDKIDGDADEFVTEEELKKWIKHVQNRYIIDDTERQWKDQNVQADDNLVWEDYVSRTFGNIGENDEFADMVRRDKRRWDKADEQPNGNGDGKMNKEEFMNFLHPEEVDHMKEIVVLETMEDIDKDGDGFISVEEYIGDMWPNDESEEPEWVQTERQQFHNFRDLDKDGKMNHDEIKEWILPSDYDHVEAEAKHLMVESDQNEDNKLSKDEVLEKYDLFVGSQATDFGEALSRHDEF